MKTKEIIVNDSISTNVFSRAYPFINKYLMDNGYSLESRAGHTREVLNFKTEIQNPYARCVGNNGRNINVFFLLAEAMWIFTGRKDVDFLTMFNSNMKDFSDDGEVFHAPYGFRLRHYGVSSKDKSPKNITEENQHAVNQMLTGTDQISVALNMLRNDSSNRRVVMSIWNSDLDLDAKTKDVPCNDLVMLKVRNGQLHTTIANRSNDLHWGLPTNVFQFSFISEIMATILGLELGTQTHNSQSLHFYTENPIAFNMYENMNMSPDGSFVDLYDSFNPARMDMNFGAESVDGRLAEIDHFLNIIIDSLQSKKKLSQPEYYELGAFSKYLTLVYDLLFIYLDYKANNVKDDNLKWSKVEEIGKLSTFFPSLDILGLAGNFFAKRIKDKDLIKDKLINPLGEL